MATAVRLETHLYHCSFRHVSVFAGWVHNRCSRRNSSWPFIHAAEASLLSVASCVIIIMWPQHDIYHSYRMSSGTAEACTRFASYWTLDQLQKPRIEHSWLCASSQNKKQAVWPSCMQVSR